MKKYKLITMSGIPVTDANGVIWSTHSPIEAMNKEIDVRERTGHQVYAVDFYTNKPATCSLL